MQGKELPEFVVALFQNGTLRVDSRGHVWRCKSIRPGRVVAGVERLPKAVKPVRIDRKTEVGGGARICIRQGSKTISVGITKIRRYFGLEDSGE